MPAALCEPVVVPINAPDVIFAQHEVFGLGLGLKDCADFAKVELHERRFHDRWVFVVEVEKSPDLVVEVSRHFILQ